MAKLYFDYGIRALKAPLPRYDRGDGTVYYDVFGKLADENYHPLLVGQMKELMEFTGDPVFETYYLRWGKPLWEPYFVRIWKERNKSGWLLFVGLAMLVWLSGSGILSIFRHVEKRRLSP